MILQYNEEQSSALRWSLLSIGHVLKNDKNILQHGEPLAHPLDLIIILVHMIIFTRIITSIIYIEDTETQILCLQFFAIVLEHLTDTPISLDGQLSL